MSVYSNLAHKRRLKKDAASRKKAEYLATLPKHPILRTIYRMHPKRVFSYWFSKQGLMMAIKLGGIGILLAVLLVGGLFAYFRKDLDSIRPGELAKRVQTTVTTYVDRNGVPLWVDKGDGNYTMAVDSKDIPKQMKEATIAIEDKNFYKHGGISVSGILRSLFNNASGGSTQGGSTLTQQLVKQVFFDPEEAQKRGLNGVPRKIKEMILAIEVERMYDKDQILTLYLNESSYGGRRNGVESAAQTYFGKDTKDLTLPEVALLAAIPNAPGLYDPYNKDGNPQLIERQHKVLNNMADLGYITQAQADEAKKYPILDNDHLKPVGDQYKDIKAPHFIQMVKTQLEQQLGKATVGKGGLVVKTTLDWAVQEKLEAGMNEMFASNTPIYAGFSNGAATVEDTKTGQIIALMGSRDFNYPGFGQDNAAMAYIQPGSSIKPLVYAQLFQQQPDGKPNYGSGSILSDDHSMDAIYGAVVKNADGGYKGNINIRSALSMSRNIPAIKAMYIAGKDETWNTIHALGDISYCTRGQDKLAGLSSAIGGCGTLMVDHTNAIASLARMGTYKPWSTILEVKNSSGNVIQKFKDESKEAISPQSAYIVNDILGDANARRRSGLYPGGGTGTPSSDAIGLKLALKTGTSDKGGEPKDIWSVAYTPNLAMSMWLGNPDTSVLKLGYSYIPAGVVDKVMAGAAQIYQDSGRGNISDWFTKPAEVQTIKGELFPSWYNQKQAQTGEDMTFDKVSKKKATTCTPDAAKVTVQVTKIADPITNNATYIAPDGYNANADDDIHACNDAKPSVTSPSVSKAGGKYKINIDVSPGRYTIKEVTITVNGQVLTTLPASAGNHYTVPFTPSDNSTQKIVATVTDDGYYQDSASTDYTP